MLGFYSEGHTIQFNNIKNAFSRHDSKWPIVPMLWNKLGSKLDDQEENVGPETPPVQSCSHTEVDLRVARRLANPPSPPSTEFGCSFHFRTGSPAPWHVGGPVVAMSVAVTVVTPACSCVFAAFFVSNLRQLLVFQPRSASRCIVGKGFFVCFVAEPGGCWMNRGGAWS